MSNSIRILARAVLVWLVIMCVEFVHGTLRTILLAPVLGDFQARQLAVFTGSLLIVAVAYLLIPPIRASQTTPLIGVGLLWLVLTVMFEFTFGRFVLGLSWQRLTSDYNVAQGGLLPFGLIVLTLAPLIATRLRALNLKPARQDGRGKSPQPR